MGIYYKHIIDNRYEHDKEHMLLGHRLLQMRIPVSIPKPEHKIGLHLTNNDHLRQYIYINEIPTIAITININLQLRPEHLINITVPLSYIYMYRQQQCVRE